LLNFLTSLLEHWKTESGAIFRSVVAEAQTDPAAAKALEDYTTERHVQTGQMVRRAQARGEVLPDIVPEVVAELVASFARGRLLTNRLDGDPEELRAAIKII